MNVTNEHLAFRPGGVSAFFVYKAGFMAAGFWAWFAVLVVRGEDVSRWHLVAAAAAITTTLVCVILGVRHALVRNAAARHEQIMHTLVELSWQAFGTPPAATAPLATAPLATAPPTDSDADVIRLAHESRPRPRR
jgi:hypothetical protein